MNIEIANRLLQYRKQHNLSQEELAEKLGISRQSVSKWERAESSPDTDNLIALAKLYGVSLDDLLFTKKDGEEAKQEQPENSPEQNPEEDAEKGNYVRVGLGGIHIKEGDDEVHVGLGGIHVKGGGEEVRVDSGVINIIEDGKLVTINWLPLSIASFICTATYLTLGAVFSLWHPGWLVFMAIPMCYNILEMRAAAGARNTLFKFPLPYICLTFFLIFGYITSVWHPTWLIFLLMPLYYSVVAAIFKKK